MGGHQHGIADNGAAQRSIAYTENRGLQRNHCPFGRLDIDGVGTRAVDRTLGIGGDILHNRRVDLGRGGHQLEIVDEPAPGEVGTNRGAFLDLELELHFGVGHILADVERLDLPPGVVRLCGHVVLHPFGIGSLMETALLAVHGALTLVVRKGDWSPLGTDIVLLVLHRHKILFGDLADVCKAQVRVGIVAQIIHRRDQFDGVPFRVGNKTPCSLSTDTQGGVNHPRILRAAGETAVRRIEVLCECHTVL